LTDSQGYSTEMTVFIVGNRVAASTLAGEGETATAARIWSHEAATAENSVARLAGALVDFEAEALGQEIDSIVLADDSDAALAAALVGTKLPVDVFAVAEARETASANSRLIAQLTAAYTAPS
jgi:hypothetical protein